LILLGHPLLPKHENSPKKRPLPKKKSKVSLLGAVGWDKDKDKGKGLSDGLRRVGVPSDSASTRGFEIYVDPTDDPEIGEIVMVKKKSRAALDGVRWGPGALGEVTNTTMYTNPNGSSAMLPKEVLKVKGEEKGEGKWWSIGRGRKDSKEKEKTAKSTLATTVRAKCKLYLVRFENLSDISLSCSSRANANNNGTSSSRSISTLQKYILVYFSSLALTNFTPSSSRTSQPLQNQRCVSLAVQLPRLRDPPQQPITMGHKVQELDASDPDSDIPDELLFILARQLDDGDALSYRAPPRLLLQRSDASLGPPILELFVEQLENVFRMPAKVDFRYGFELGWRCRYRLVRTFLGCEWMLVVLMGQSGWIVFRGLRRLWI
jgi:hypothetical protein